MSAELADIVGEAVALPAEVRQEGLPAHELFGVRIHAVCMNQAVETLLNWLSDAQPTCRYVVTPNVDHIVKLRSNVALREAYGSASLVVADGWPLVSASRWLGRPLPERIAGSDLTPMLFSQSSTNQPIRVFLLGAAPGIADLAATNIRRQWPTLDVCGTLSPPPGFEFSKQESQQILVRVNAASPDVLLVGFGAPKQEIWLAAHYRQLNASVAIAGGATIDFLAGRQKRAPRWLQKLRLAARYLHDAWVFPQLVFAEMRLQRQQNAASSAAVRRE